MPDIANLYDFAPWLASLSVPVELFIMWLLYRKGRGKPLPQWLKRTRVFSAFDTIDVDKYWAGVRVFARK